MELCSGGDLYSRDPYTEDEAARIVGSILSAVSFMHHKKIVHRDLKYENILFANSSPMAEIKLIDFGLSKKYVSEKELTEGVGTVRDIQLDIVKTEFPKPLFFLDLHDGSRGVEGDLYLTSRFMVCWSSRVHASVKSDAVLWSNKKGNCGKNHGMRI
jgi:serine/threonine protein kinase